MQIFNRSFNCNFSPQEKPDNPCHRNGYGIYCTSISACAGSKGVMVLALNRGLQVRSNMSMRTANAFQSGSIVRFIDSLGTRCRQLGISLQACYIAHPGGEMRLLY